MSIEYYRRQIQSRLHEISRLQDKKARETGRISDFQKRSNEASAKAGRASSAQSYLRDTQRYAEQAAGVQREIGELERKIAREHEKMESDQKCLSNEETHAADKRRRDEERKERENAERMKIVGSKLSTHESLHRQAFSMIERLAQLPEKITVLFMAANPVDQQQLRLDEEARSISEMVRKSKHRDAVKLESCWAVRPLDVLQAINEHRPTIVHFSGHGSDQDEIVFQDESGETKLVSKEAIVQTMAAGSSEIKLVFFNTCYSRNQAESVVNHVQCAVGMKTSIGDAAARVFASQFYSAIGFGLSVKRAFNQAKAALMLEGIPEEDAPELFVSKGIDSDQLILVKPADT